MYKTAIARQRRNKRIYKKFVKYFALKKWTFKKFERASFKFAASILLVAMSVGTLGISKTNSFYNDEESSIENVFQASMLGISLSGFNVSDVVFPGDATTTAITLSKSNSAGLDYKYIASTTIIGTDQTACNYMTISASNSSQNYSDVSLKDFISGTGISTDPAQWDFIFTVVSVVPAGDLGKVCNFKIIYKAWQTDFPDNSGGFNDVAEMTGSITIGQVIPDEPSLGNVVINEIMWMGSQPSSDHGSTADEWVELRNMTSEEIDLSGWKIENLGTNPNSTITIPSGTIAANGYFLIANYPAVNSAINSSIAVDFNATTIQLLNSGEILILKDAGGNTIDETPSGNWAAGDNTGAEHKSMERNMIPGDGTFTASWHTCIAGGCSTADFWKSIGINYGTPRSVNLSENDPTMPDYTDQNWSYTIGWESDDNDIIDDSERVAISGFGGGGGDSIAQDMEINETTLPVIEPQPSPEAPADTEVVAGKMAGEDEPATAPTVPEEPAELVTEPEPAIEPEEISEAPSPSQGEGVGDEVVNEPAIIVEPITEPEPAVSEPTAPVEPPTIEPTI